MTGAVPVPEVNVIVPLPLLTSVGDTGILPACVDTFHEKGAAVFVSVVGL